MPAPAPPPGPVPPAPPAPPAPAAPPVRSVGRELLPHAPAAPLRALVAVGAVAALAARVLPGERPGAGVAVLALALALAVVVVVRDARPAGRAGRPGGWQLVHGTAAVLLASSAALRDAGWVVALDLLAALLLGALALAPTGRVRVWSAVLLAPLRPLARVAAGTGWTARGVRRVLLLRAARPRRAARRWPWLVPALRATAVTAVLLVVFVPLLASADARFGGLLEKLTGSTGTWLADALSRLASTLLGTRPDLVVGRAVVFALAAVALSAALSTAWDAARQSPAGSTSGSTGGPPAGRRPRPVLARRVEWLLPLGALDALFAAFLVVRLTSPEVADTAGATLAGQVHAGFAQLVVATALVLAVVALAVRCTPMTAGPRTALALLCALSLGLDAAALADLRAYVDAYGLTRLRIGVGVVCAGLAGLLVLLLVAGARWQRRRQQPWVPHAAVAVAAACLLGLTAADPDAAIARAQLARGATGTAGSSASAGPDVAYLSTLSADAAPALADALREDPTALGAEGPCVLWSVAGGQSEQDASDEGWPSANLSRARAADLAELLSAAEPPCAAVSALG